MQIGVKGMCQKIAKIWQFIQGSISKRHMALNALIIQGWMRYVLVCIP